MPSSAEEYLEDAEHGYEVQRKKRSVDDDGDGPEASAGGAAPLSQKAKIRLEEIKGDGKMQEMLSSIANQLLSDITDLKTELIDLRLPRGLKDNPATSCHDILLAHPESADGMCSYLSVLSSQWLNSALGNSVLLYIR